MKKIALSQGQFAIVDDDDFEKLSRFKWYSRRQRLKSRHTFYAWRLEKIDGKWRCVQMHRSILSISGSMKTDHRNGDGLDNRKSNIRPATFLQNNRHKRKTVGTSSRYKGVCWDKNQRKWMAEIGVDNRRIYLGRFAQEKAAAIAYDEAAIKHFGEFASLNFP